MTQTQKKNVPTLRFSEFEGEWENFELGDLIEITSASRVHKNEWTKSGVPFFRSSDVVAEYKDLNNQKAYISLELYRELSSKSGCVKKNDLLVTGGGSIGIPYLVKTNDPLYFKDADLLWLKNSNRINGFYLYTFFLTSTFRKYISSITHIGTISHYTIEQAKSTPIKVPNSIEQQKIAAFLTAVDEKIAQLGQKKTLLETYKKGCMQQLFSQEIRFKDDDGRDFPDWQEKKFGEILIITMGQSPDSASYNEESIGLPLIQGNADISNRKSVPRRYTSMPTKKCQIGDILISVRAPIGEVSLSLHEACIGRGMAVINMNSTQIHSFWYQFLISQEKKWTRIGQGSTFSAINASDIKNISIQMPHPDEQNKIADFISAIDTKITLVTEELELTRTFKKGLLQQMFV